MAQQFSLTPLSLPDTNQAPVAPIVAARPVAAIPIPSGDGGGSSAALMNGLSFFNSNLRQYANTEMKQAADKATEDGKLAGTVADKQELDPTNPTAIVPTTVGPAWNANWQFGYRQAVGERVALQGKTDMLAEYNARKDDPEFNPRTFEKQWRDQQYAGVTDPVVLQAIASHHEEASLMMSADYAKVQQAQSVALTQSAVQSVLDDRITADMTPQEIQGSLNGIYESSKSMAGMNRADFAQMAFGKVVALSDAAKGSPELFKSLTDFKDPITGLTIAQMNPKMIPMIAKAQEAAVNQRDHRLTQAAVEDNTKYRMNIQDRLKSDPQSITDEELLSNLTDPSKGRYGRLSEGEILAIRKQRDAATSDTDDLAEARKFVAIGQGYLLPEAKQKAVMTELSAPAITMLSSALQDPTRISDPNTGAAAIAANLVGAYTKGGLNIANTQVKQLMTSLAAQVPGKDGEPTTQFKVASAVYNALPPNMRDLYTDEKSKKLLDNYTDQTNRGADPKTAFQGSYASISPEADRVAAEMTKTPDFQTKLQKLAVSAVDGSHSWVPFSQALGLSPKNEASLGQDAKAEAIKFYTRNPNASESDLQSYMKDYIGKNFVLDKGTGYAVQIPPGANPDQLRESMSAYTAQLALDNRIKDRTDGSWTVALVPKNLQQGTYTSLLMRNGNPVGTAGPEVSANQMNTMHASATALTEQDRANLAMVQTKLKDGSATVDDLTALSTTLAKTRTLGLLPSDTQRQMDGLKDAAFRNRLANMPQLAIGTPTAGNILDNSKPVKVDNQMTARIAQGFLNESGTNLNANPSGPYQSSGYRGMAGALITMGESAVLQAYPDPAKGAGNNIGMGYNLNANAATRNADLKAAGVPPEQIDNVINGRAALTEDQATRLLKVSLPRYEATAHASVDKLDPQLWDRMTNQQKAVLMDVAYQVGTPDKFPTALKSLLAGDQQAFSDQLQVHYKNADGVMVNDTRRNNLRAHLLASSANFSSVIGEVGKKPSTKLDALLSSK